MDIQDARRFHQNAMAAMTIATQGIEQVERAVEVYTARGGATPIEALKYDTPSTPEEEEFNAEIDAILADISELAPVATAMGDLFAASNRSTMMKLRTDI